ncbi:MAG TPA: zinc ribbon domain-containing protein [Flavobacterium sp.]|uniref:zinc ribbon domain-containing protein n=1 Tax=Flavobacterium sp. TaxID=239 RepID=UPI002F3F4ACE
MEDNLQICQSCGMPLDKDPNNGGTNADNSISDKYCSFCFKDGKFLDEGISLQEKIYKNIQIAVSRMGIPKSKAREMADNIIPHLERWKS